MDELVAIAQVAKPRGLRGEVVANLLTDFPLRFEGLEEVVAVATDGRRSNLIIENFWFQKDRIILKFETIETVEQAEELRGIEICIPESAAAELDDDEFFDWQLKGCTVETAEGKLLGLVREIMRTGGTEILVVEDEGREYMIPFAESICTDVDIEGKLIRVDPPDGLLEF